MHRLFFKLGSLAVAICSMLLAIAVIAPMFLHRGFTDIEQVIAGIVAVALGTTWWIAMHRRSNTNMRAMEGN